MKISDGKKAKAGTSNEKKPNQTAGEEETDMTQIGPASTEKADRNNNLTTLNDNTDECKASSSSSRWAIYRGVQKVKKKCFL